MLPLIGKIQLVFHCDAVYFTITQTVFAFFFKTTFNRQNKISHQRLHVLHHDNKLIAVLIHEMDVFFTKISAIKNETDLLISIPLYFQQHLLELEDINDTSGVLLIIKRLRVVVIISDQIIQNRFPIVIFRMFNLNTLKITYIAILVSRIISDIDLLDTLFL